MRTYLHKAAALLLCCMLLLNGCGGTAAVQAPSSGEAASARKAESAAPASSGAASAAPPSQAAPAEGTSSTEASSDLASAVEEAPAGPLAGGERVADSYFDDAVFIGDSVSLKLKNYVTQKRKEDAGFFGGAQFLAAGSMGSGNALNPVGKDSIHPLVKGEKLSLPDGVAALGAKKVYLMLGINDIVIYGIDGAVDNMEKLITQILEKTPDAAIFVQSATPMLKERQKQKLNNENLAAYDEKLAARCREKGWYFVDVASVMRDEQGNLKASYCSDPNDGGLHFTDEACQVWLDYLYTHAAR